mmetsp:Transcript_29480/g.33088  ORF Transcript_29480/g.33088 Transcript_29480/m.33088 type:complete len:88 (-) Transcript_29480:315-578(-)
MEENHKEIVKSVAVFGTATTCSVAGQALTGAVLIGVVGASLPVAGVIALAVGCVSGVTGSKTVSTTANAATTTTASEGITRSSFPPS